MASFRTIQRTGRPQASPPSRPAPAGPATRKEKGSIVALTAWGDQHAAPDGPPIIYQHAACGSEIHQQICCAACDEQVRNTDITVRPDRACCPQTPEATRLQTTGEHRAWAGPGQPALTAMRALDAGRPAHGEDRSWGSHKPA
jgi:hypothetical protein